jgi:hypothetical protein
MKRALYTVYTNGLNERNMRKALHHVRLCSRTSMRRPARRCSQHNSGQHKLCTVSSYTAMYSIKHYVKHLYLNYAWSTLGTAAELPLCYALYCSLYWSLCCWSLYWPLCSTLYFALCCTLCHITHYTMCVVTACHNAAAAPHIHIYTVLYVQWRSCQ